VDKASVPMIRPDSNVVRLDRNHKVRYCMQTLGISREMLESGVRAWLDGTDVIDGQTRLPYTIQAHTAPVVAEFGADAP